MAARVRAGLFALVLLAGCDGSTPDAPRNAAVPDASAPTTAGQSLENLAVESGVLSDTPDRDPAGGYGRGYEGGRDRLCVLGQDAASGDHRFAIEIRIGAEEYCRGTGTVRQQGDALTFRFDAGGCSVTARYEGDRIRFPGAVDGACAALCSRRASLAGVSLPRLSDGESGAVGVTNKDGAPLCG